MLILTDQEQDLLHRLNQEEPGEIDLDRHTWETAEGREAAETQLRKIGGPMLARTYVVELGVLLGRPNTYLLPLQHALVPLPGHQRVPSLRHVEAEALLALAGTGPRGKALALHLIRYRMPLMDHLSVEIGKGDELENGVPTLKFRHKVRLEAWHLLYGHLKGPIIKYPSVLERLHARWPFLLAQGDAPTRKAAYTARVEKATLARLQTALAAEAQGCRVRGFDIGQPILDYLGTGADAAGAWLEDWLYAYLRGVIQAPTS